MHRVHTKDSSDPRQEPPSRLPVRWAVILATAAMVSFPVGVLGGRPAAIGVFFMVAGTLHLMIG